MTQTCGNCGGYLSISDSDSDEGNCSSCGICNKIVPDIAIKDPQNQRNITFGEFLKYPSLSGTIYQNIDQRQFEGVITSMPILENTEALVQKLDYVYQVNTERSLKWLGEVTGSSIRFPCNVIALEILGNMGFPGALEEVVKNLSFTYLSEDMKASSSGGSLFSTAIRSMANYSNAKMSDINFAGLATCPYIPAPAVVAVPELIRTVQEELFRLEKAVGLIRKFGVGSLAPLWNLQSFTSERIDLFIACCYLRLGMAGEKILSIVQENLRRPIKQHGDYVAMIVLGDTLVEYAATHKDDYNFVERIHNLLIHNEPRVSIAVAGSTLYRNYFILSGQAIQMNQAYFSSLIPALVYAKYFNQNTESAMYLDAQTNPNLAKEIHRWESAFQKQ